MLAKVRKRLQETDVELINCVRLADPSIGLTLALVVFTIRSSQSCQHEDANQIRAD
ncbi:hypothetical protein ABGB14_48705 [Nonomuraea sp. B10E15]|uniref:hypothetical protein n=1 Tax=Nonomuraea sp. B10E15 TaxID=3153560 RepID=UPI00325E5E61